VVKPSTSPPSQLSPANWPPEAFAWWRSLAVLVTLLATFVIWEALTALYLRATGTSVGNIGHGALKLTWTITLAQLSTYIPILVTLFATLPWLSARSLRDLGLRRFTQRDLAFAAAGTVAMYGATIAIAALQYSFTHEEPKEQAVTLFTSTKDPLLVLAFGMVATIAAPFAEELVFRGFIFNALLRYLPVAAAAVFSGLLFGAAHVLGSSWTVMAPLAASGIVLAYVYYLSGSLTASMLTHAAFNIINVLLITAGRS
jgi:membrane protease YdiL (CAAX protease family)